MLASLLMETPVIFTGNACQSEIDALWQQMEIQQQFTQKLLDKEIDWEFYFDFMAQSGIEPEELIDTAQENLDFAIKENIILEL